MGQSDYYYYKPENNFGSDQHFHPINLILNGSYDIFRNGNHGRNLFVLPYEAGFRNVIANISTPFQTIEEYGWDNFRRRELLNFESDFNEAQFYPNIAIHVIGNGVLYVKAAEWFDYHGYRYPYLLSFATTTVYQVLNEVVENGGGTFNNVDPVSDLLIFNPLGFLLFSFDAPRAFFAERVRVYDWSLQPMLNPWNRELHNVGQNYSAKISLPNSERLSFFTYWGIHGMGGISYNYRGSRSISVGAGAVARKIKTTFENNNIVFIPEVDGAMGIFLDQNNSLLASLVITGPDYLNARVNIYPGWYKQSRWSPGIFIGSGKIDGFQFGISFRNIPVGILSGHGSDES